MLVGSRERRQGSRVELLVKMEARREGGVETEGELAVDVDVEAAATVAPLRLDRGDGAAGRAARGAGDRTDGQEARWG